MLCVWNVVDQNEEGLVGRRSRVSPYSKARAVPGNTMDLRKSDGAKEVRSMAENCFPVLIETGRRKRTVEVGLPPATLDGGQKRPEFATGVVVVAAAAAAAAWPESEPCTAAASPR